ncbi:hypothetical protein [Providencia rettgeri]|uniref:hypothetical protein n=1 Tax=Providencia rettgeri TaxID=587 RepID=UPI0024B8D845|nr:hypothetical protein [Providencia rettgeri]WHT81920.1 hypothetical protein KOL65_22040 [Providencia rettgeri]
MDYLMDLAPKYFYIASVVAAIIAVVITFSTKKSNYKHEFKELSQIFGCLSIVLGMVYLIK